MVVETALPGGTGRHLSAEEELALARRSRAGDVTARSRLVERNVGLVVGAAASWRRSGVAFEDLVQDGFVGLLEAVERFDPDKGYRLSTYAVYWIRRRIRAGARGALPIRVPENAASQAGEVARAREELRRHLGRSPSDEDVADRLGWNTRRITTAGQALPRITSINTGDRPEDLSNDDDSVAEAVLQVLEHERLARLVRCLSDREQRVLTGRYGLGGGEPERFRLLARELGVSEERVRQIQRRAEARLRRGMTDYRAG